MIQLVLSNVLVAIKEVPANVKTQKLVFATSMLMMDHVHQEVLNVLQEQHITNVPAQLVQKISMDLSLV